jgi:hypothetical protein
MMRSWFWRTIFTRRKYDKSWTKTYWCWISIRHS